MNTIDKHTALIGTLAAKTNVLARAQRISIEMKYPPTYRTFVLVDAPMTAEDLANIDTIATEHGCDTNAFKAGGKVSTITFVDMDEKRSDR